MDVVLSLLTDTYNMINDSINLEQVIGFDMGLFEFFLAVFVLFTVCSVILVGLFGKVVEYIQRPTEEEQFHEDVYNYRYRSLVGTVTRMQSERNRQLNALSNTPITRHSYEYAQSHMPKASAKTKLISRHRRKLRSRGEI